MSASRDLPQLYLITPPEIDLAVFPDRLAACLDRVPVACLRLALSSRDEDVILRAGDALRAVAHDRDVAIVIESHAGFVERLGLDGVHLPDAARSVRSMRKDLGADAIIGAFCGNLRHDGITAGEHGADYVSFGPVGRSALGDGRTAPLDLFQWWSEMIEVPVVAEGHLDPALIRALSPHADFIALGPELWRTEQPATTLALLAAARDQG